MANGDSSNASSNASLAQMLTQMAPFVGRLLSGFKFLMDQPIIRQPYYLATSGANGPAPGSQIIAAGQTNVPLVQSDFSHSLSWPFEVHRIRISLDPQHTLRDLRVAVIDQTYNQSWMKNPTLADGLVNADTGFWELGFPWIIRPEGGGQQYNVDNLDTVNPISVSFTLHGFLLIPAAQGRGQ
jgi:hypothetical protein